MNISTVGKVGAVFVGLSMIAVSLTPFLTSAAADGQLNVLINGAPPSAYCIAGPITVSGTGVTGGQGGNWHLTIGWGDGTASSTESSGITVTPTGQHVGLDGSSNSFSYTSTHTLVATTTGITVILYHSQPSGEDGQVVVVNQCIAAPTQGVVILAKHVVNDNTVNLGTATASEFTLTLNGTNVTGAEAGATPGVLLTAGTYAITETGPSGYTRVSTVCGNGTATTTTNGTSGSVTVVAGENYRCTITNNDTEPSYGGLVVVKNVVNTGGGTKSDSYFAISVKESSTNNHVAGSPAAGSTSGTSYTLVTGSYVVSETADTHYTSDFSDCAGGNVTVTENATTTCIIENVFHNALPTPNNSSVITDEDMATSSDVTGNDADNDDLTFAVVLGPTNGILSSFDGNTGAFTYTPDADYSGADSFTFTVADLIGNGLTNGAVSITINPINDDPTAENDFATVLEDSLDNIVDVLANDTSDPDTGETLAVQSVGSAANGTVVLDASVVKYTPNAGYVGSDSFTYTITDGNGGTDTATVDVTVGGTNDAPVANSDTATTEEDTATTTVNVLANDTDVDGDDVLSVCDADTTSEEGGTVVNNGDGTFTYTPPANFNGTDSFQYFVCDGNDGGDTGTVTIMVNSVNDAPVTTGQSIITDQNYATSSVLDASDVDLDSLTFATTSNPTNGTLSFFNTGTGQFTYTPTPNFNGPDSFTFKANDGTADSNESTVSITVNELSENTLELCTDGLDNDNDASDTENGGTDLEDADCAEFLPALTIVKTTVGGDATFSFSVTGMDAFPITTSEGTGTSGLVTLPDEGTYSVTEDSLEGWTFTDSSCVYDNESTGTEIEMGESITVDAGDAVTCTFVNTIIPTGSDISVTKTVDDSTPDNGQNVTFTLTVVNNGPAVSSVTTVTDLLPSGLEYVSDNSEGTYATSTGVWTIGSMQVNATNTIQIVATVTASAGTEITNAATAAHENSETNEGNDEGSVTFTVNTPEPVTPPSSGGGGGGGGGNGPIVGSLGAPAGQVLGASTSTVGQVLGVSCGLYMEKHLRRGSFKNDREQTVKLQAFLNKWINSGLPTTGFFGPLTENAVKVFQTKYSQEVLAPWGISKPTGLVYLSTLRQLNLLECPQLSLQLPALVPWSQNPNAQ